MTMTLKSGSEVTQVHWKWYYSIDCVWFPISVLYKHIVSKMHRFWDIRLQKCRDLENWVTGTSRSLEMSPCDRSHMTSYWRFIVTTAQSRVVSEIFNVEKCRDLDQRSLKCHWKWYHSVDRVWFPTRTLSLKCTVFEIFNSQVYSDLETRVHSRSPKVIPFNPAAMTSY